MYVAVCDDRPEDRELLLALLNQWQTQRKTTLRGESFCNAAKLLDAARKRPFTLYLLDVMMPGMSGLEVAREIRSFQESADLVFLTSSSEFAYESYGVQALDYLLKPIHKEHLFSLLDRIALRDQKPEAGLTLKCGTCLIRILFSQLSYVEVSGKHLYFHMTDGSVQRIFGTLSEFEPTLLRRPEFMRTHRSYIVNMLQAAELSPTCVRTFSGAKLPVSRLQYPQLHNDYMKLLFHRED